MADPLRPDSEAALAAAVRAAVAERAPLAIRGGGSKAGFGRPVQAARGLSVAGLDGITLYAPEELVISARAGTPLDTLTAALAAQGQELAFEPPDWAGLWGGVRGVQTVGGAVSCNLAGPRRIAAGAARDHVLGLRAVNGRGEAIKSGGRVVKNVTGYDLCKLWTGAFGTLGVLTEVTLKVRPAGKTETTLLLPGGDPAAAVAAMSAALGSPWDVSAAAHLPASVAARIPQAGGPVTALRLEGFPDPVAERAAKLRARLAEHGRADLMDAGDSAALWAAVRDATPFHGGAGPLWRVSVAPSDGPAAAARIMAAADADILFDWGGGLLWVSLADAADGGAAAVRGALDGIGGHATLVRAPDAVRAAVPVFEPPAAPVAALSARLKAAFDPHGILNPGRMYPEA